MADAMDTLKNILGDDAEDKIKTVMNSLSSADNTSEGIEQFKRFKSNYADKKYYGQYGGEQKRSENKFTPFVKAVYA